MSWPVVPITTIQIDVATRNQLLMRGHMGETYNDVIQRLLAMTLDHQGTRRREKSVRRLPVARS